MCYDLTTVIPKAVKKYFFKKSYNFFPDVTIKNPASFHLVQVEKK